MPVSHHARRHSAAGNTHNDNDDDHHGGIVERMPSRRGSQMASLFDGLSGGGNESQDIVGQVSHKDSVYSFMLIMPPLARSRRGHYWTRDVLLAFALFCLVVLMQLSLTFIASHQIYQDFSSFQLGLINDESQIWSVHNTMTLDGLLNKFGKLSSGAKDRLKQYAQKTSDAIGSVSKKNQSIADDEVLGSLRGSNVATSSGQRRRQFVLSPSEDPLDKGLARYAGARAAGVGSAGAANGTDHCCVGAYCSAEHVCCPPGNSGQSVDKFTNFFQRKKSGSISDKDGATSSATFNFHLSEIRSGSVHKELLASDALCHKANNELSCLPPEAMILDFWEELDENSDGQWSIEEAKKDTMNFACHVGIPLEDLFRSACRGLVRDANERTESMTENRQTPVAMPYAVKRFKAIPRDYFLWWKGIVGLCMHTDVGLCDSMISRGMFDGVLNGTGSMGASIDSIMAYCRRLVSPGGICDASMSGSYVMYRSRMEEHCGKPVLAAGPKYQHPSNPHDVLHTTELSYTTLQTYRSVHETKFLFFMFIVLILWYVSIVNELKDVLMLWDFVFNFDVENMLTPEMSKRLSGHFEGLSAPLRRMCRSFIGLDQQDEPQHEGPPSHRGAKNKRRSSKIQDHTATGHHEQTQNREIKVIGRFHHIMCIMMGVARSMLVMYLGVAGSIFLISNRSYMDLLLNALALTFIFEIDEFLYYFLVPEGTKDMLNDVKPLTFPTSLPKTGWSSLLMSKYFWGITFIPFFAFYYVVTSDSKTTVPVLEALECACLKSGEHCVDAQLVSSGWWTHYWAHVAKLQ